MMRSCLRSIWIRTHDCLNALPRSHEGHYFSLFFCLQVCSSPTLFSYDTNSIQSNTESKLPREKTFEAGMNYFFFWRCFFHFFFNFFSFFLPSLKNFSLPSFSNNIFSDFFSFFLLLCYVRANTRARINSEAQHSNFLEVHS